MTPGAAIAHQNNDRNTWNIKFFFSCSSETYHYPLTPTFLLPAGRSVKSRRRVNDPSLGVPQGTAMCGESISEEEATSRRQLAHDREVIRAASSHSCTAPPKHQTGSRKPAAGEEDVNLNRYALITYSLIFCYSSSREVASPNHFSAYAA
jgi:hypothetical protein